MSAREWLDAEPWSAPWLPQFAADVYAGYADWCRAARRGHVSSGAFSREMAAMGFIKVRINKVWHYEGPGAVAAPRRQRPGDRDLRITDQALVAMKPRLVALLKGMMYGAGGSPESNSILLELIDLTAKSDDLGEQHVDSGMQGEDGVAEDACGVDVVLEPELVHVARGGFGERVEGDTEPLTGSFDRVTVEVGSGHDAPSSERAAARVIVTISVEP